jgi:hypothetical protein
MATTAVPKTKAAAKTEKPAVVEDIREIAIPELEMRQAILNIVGISGLIQHQWSKKALAQIEGKQTGKAMQQKTARVPDEEWVAAAYIVPGKEELIDWKPGKYFHPASAFKHAFLYGVSQLDDKRIPKTKATGWLFVDRDPVLDFSGVVLRTDIGRNPTQPVYRPEFTDWSCELFVSFNARTVSLEQVVAIMDLGLFCGGIGEWRPSAPKNKSGSFGRARVKSVEELS